MKPALTPVVCALAALPLLAPPAAAQNAVGSEFQISSYTPGAQRSPDVVALPNGDYVVAWQGDTGNATTDAGVFARRYSVDGTALGSEFQVGSLVSGYDERQPAIAASRVSGNFTIAWHFLAISGNTTNGDVVARRYSSTGTALGVEFLVNTYTTANQLNPSIGVADDGSFVVAWESYGAHDGSGIGVFAQRFSSGGSALGGEFQVNTYTTTAQRRPAAGMASDGSFVVVWESQGPDGSDRSISGQRYASGGSPLGSEFQVNTYTAGRQYKPALGMAGSGDFVVAWESVGQDGDANGIFAQRYASSGSPLGGEFQVNTFTTGAQVGATVEVAPNGEFLIGWNQGDAMVQRYASDGTPLGGEFTANTETFDRQEEPAIASSGDDFLVVWQSFGQDGDDWGIYGQRFTTLLDLGDAPDSYSTLLASNGAGHVQPSSLYLGLSVDDEPDGQPSAGADGDDLDGNDDEDGVTFTSVLVPGSMASVDVSSSGSGFLNAFVDFDLDGDFGDAGEAIFTDQPVGAGVNSLSFPVPAGAVGGTTYARFRVSSAGGDSFDGIAADGEVEDHLVSVGAATSIAQMISPIPGTTFAATSATFVWSAGTGATEYWLQVGTTKPGSRQIFDGSVGTNLSQAVSGLPGGSVPIYVRLWTFTGGQWFRIDYTYTAINGLAMLTGPASPLTATTHTFTWSAGVGTNYWLQVGTTGAGSREIFNAAVAGTSQSVSGLPTGSVNVYVRLWTFINGSWRGPGGQNINDYVFTSAP